jgi:hypothetical protein
MALTVTKDGHFNTNYSINAALAYGMKMEMGSIAFDSSYPTGGEALAFGFTPAIVIAEPNLGYVFQYDYTNKKLLAYYADYDAVADGALIQVANTTNLSGLTAVKYVAFGW